VLHPFNADVLGAAIDLVDAGPIGGRDAVHAATALGAGFTQIVTTDVAFDSVSGLTRLDPRQA
jgi:predicted nucleic acid-binding protein